MKSRNFLNIIFLFNIDEFYHVFAVIPILLHLFFVEMCEIIKKTVKKLLFNFIEKKSTYKVRWKWRIFFSKRGVLIMKKRKLTLFCTGILATTLLLAPSAEAATYVVKKGDNLTKISKAHNTTVNNLKTWNQLNNDTIYVGQTLIIENSKKTNATPTKVNKTQLTLKKQTVSSSANTYNNQAVSNSQSTTYKVVSGDTLSKIANKFNLTVASLKSMNDLTSDLIYVGQELKVSEMTVSEVDSSQSIDEKVVEDLKADQAISEQLAKESIIYSSPKNREVYEEVVNLAESLVDTPYLFGGNTPEGFDCSGFVQYVYSNAGLSIVRESSEDYFMKKTTKVQTPVAGDVIFFKNTYKSGISHMGIYIGDGEFIHASSNGVEVAKLSHNYWDTRFVAFKRFNNVK